MDFHFARGEEATLRLCSKHVAFPPLFRRHSEWSAVLMASDLLGRWESFHWLHGSCSAEHWAFSISGDVFCSIRFLPPSGDSPTRTGVFTYFHEKKNQIILSKAQCLRLLISTPDPPVGFVFHLQTTHQPLEDCRWYPWLWWKKMPKACVNICKPACPLQLALPAFEARGNAVIKQKNRGALHSGSSHSLPFLHLPKSSYSCQHSLPRSPGRCIWKK